MAEGSSDAALPCVQASMERETRRIVLRWLAGANPPIDGPLALAVLDTERCGGVKPAW